MYSYLVPLSDVCNVLIVKSIKTGYAVFITQQKMLQVT